jgi:hypothetical protein
LAGDGPAECVSVPQATQQRDRGRATPGGNSHSKTGVEHLPAPSAGTHQETTAMIRNAAAAALLGVAVLMAGCTDPNDPGQRMLGGAGLGAAGGAALGAIAGGGRGAAVGALLGGATGAVVGGATTPQPHYQQGYAPPPPPPEKCPYGKC